MYIMGRKKRVFHSLKHHQNEIDGVFFYIQAQNGREEYTLSKAERAQKSI